MTFSFKRMYAIFQKDWQELYKNYYILFTIAMPLAFAALIGREGDAVASFASLPITLSLVLSGVFVQATMIAEEKEKNTLRGLLLSPASTSEILIGKSALTAVLTIGVVIGSVFFSDFHVNHVVWFAVLILINLVFYISVGTIIGLISRTVMETMTVGMPVMILFGMVPMFISMIENQMILKVLSFLPSERFTAVWQGMEAGEGFTQISIHLLILAFWAIAGLAAAFIIYRKRQFD